ncbi:hypothetical protein Drose_18765 [Dactylosporangium roseum]|uniref:Integral membrane protein n=1 Tax=Dactylosporangium roseum TaxID=47989 RepID=A0ABY5ZF53_9ACTN|nr:hypothetical protein [Dactylosporangium roseum]UWZ40057.1 hypothetical protein Drose_18765 [Dactylosporangium roseum]
MSYAWQQPFPARTTAPVSLHVVAIFQYLGGLVTLAIGGLFALAAFELVPELHYDTSTGRYADVKPAAGVIFAVFAVVGLTAIVLGRKVQRGRDWARIVLTVLNLLSVAAGLWQGYTTGRAYGATLVSIALPLLFVVLLNTRAARSWCRHRTY